MTEIEELAKNIRWLTAEGNLSRDIANHLHALNYRRIPDDCVVVRTRDENLERGASAAADQFYEHIKHGDEKHRAWLRDECSGKLVELIRQCPSAMLSTYLSQIAATPKGET